MKHQKLKFASPPNVVIREHDALQDYYHDGTGDYYSVARLVDDTKHLTPFEMPLACLDLSPQIWKDCTIFELAAHVKRVNEADLTKPIILDWNGSLADGRHRVIKAIIEGKTTIPAVRMTWKQSPCGTNKESK